MFGIRHWKIYSKKNFLRRHFYENKTFQQVKQSFFNFLNKKIFNFEKCNWYLEIPQPV